MEEIDIVPCSFFFHDGLLCQSQVTTQKSLYFYRRTIFYDITDNGIS